MPTSPTTTTTVHCSDGSEVRVTPCDNGQGYFLSVDPGNGEEARLTWSESVDLAHAILLAHDTPAARAFIYGTDADAGPVEVNRGAW